MRHRRGAVAVMIAIMIPVLLAFAGLAIDLGIWYRESVRLQLAADAGAEGAARLLAGQSAAAGDFQSAALIEVRGITGSNWIGTLATPVGISVASDWSQVTVTLKSTADRYFTKPIGIAAPALNATATAGIQVQSACILALSTSAAPAIQVDNMGSLTATGCGIFADSTASKAIYLNSGTISGKSVGAAGGIATSNSGSNTLSPASGNSNATPRFDPYSSLPPPSPGACNYTNASFTAYQSTPYQFTQASNVFCGTTTIGGNNTTDSFAPGTYYIVNGDLVLNNASITQAQGVTFVLTGTTPGAFTWTNYSNTATTMTAPTSGPLSGILVWQTCPASGTPGAITLAGGSTLRISGEFYAPCGALKLSNNAKLASVSGSGMGVIASTIYATGSASISANAGGSTGGSAQITLLQ
jgi:hypothetical protein